MDYSIKLMPVTELTQYVNNPKEHTPEQIKNIAQSITEFGFIWPILLDKENMITAGHGRLLAAKHLGLTEVATMRADHLTEEQVKAFRLADNRLAQANWLEDPLREEMEALVKVGYDLALTGFSDKELNDAMKKAHDPAAPVVEAETSEEADEKFQVLVTCKEEPEQVKLIERLDKEGYQCRALIS